MVNESVNVLLIDDDPEFAEFVQSLPTVTGDNTLRIDCVEDLDDAATALEVRQYDAVLLDPELSDSGESQAVQHILSLESDAAVIVLIPPSRERSIRYTSTPGVQDYFIKAQQDAFLLVRTIHHAVERCKISIELRESRRTLGQRVKERTDHLRTVNQRLLDEIHHHDATQQQLRKEHAFNEAILKTIGALIVVLDTEGRIVYFNHTSEKISGHHTEYIRGRFIWDLLLPPEDAETTARLFRQYHWTERPTQYENHWISADGKKYLIRWSNTFLFDEHDRLEYIIATGIDITERAKAQRAERKVQRRLKAVFNSSFQFIALLDRHGTVLETNRTSLRFIHAAEADVIGKPFWRSPWWQSSSQNQDQIKHAVVKASQGHYLREEAAILLPHLEKPTLYLDYSITPTLEEDGMVDLLIWEARDITDLHQKDAEARQRMLSHAHQDRLVTMGEMATEIAHEINQPLAAIANYSEGGRSLLENRKLDIDELLNVFTKISKQTKRAGTIIHSLRKFVSKNEFNPVSQDINRCIIEVIELVNFEIQHYGIELAYQLDQNIPPLKLDRLLIEQVLVNIIRNAVDALKDSNKAKHITISSNLSARHMVKVNVSDNGSGLTDEAVKKVFQPYFSTKAEGVGMGLAICRSIIAAHGGTIGVGRNRIEDGAEFYFTLPCS